MSLRTMFGLRGRLVTALVLTSAATLVVAAIALFSPLEHQLQNDEFQSLREAAIGARASLRRVSSDDLQHGSPELTRLVRTLRKRTAAEVVVVAANGRALAGIDSDPRARYPEGRRAILTRKTQRGFSGAGGQHDALIASPVTVENERVALILQRPLAEVQSAVSVVQGAFATAALAGLLVALMLGMLVAARLVRRLRELTTTVTRIADIGPTAELASDSSTDEVGALTRSFARMQRRLNEQERARRTFVATASHELRTPLASLQLMLDGLVDDLGDEQPRLDDALSQAQRAQAQSALLSKLSSELLDLSRIDAGLRLRSEPVELRELSRSVVGEFAARAAAGTVSLRVSGTQQAWALADPGSAAQIARILIDNALRFAPARSTVHVTVGATPKEATLAVSDEGPGVAPAERELIFERFRRGSETAGYPGFGLGLAIGRELARRMNGELAIRAAGAGACFVLTIEAAAISPDGDGQPT